MNIFWGPKLFFVGYHEFDLVKSKTFLLRVCVCMCVCVCRISMERAIWSEFIYCQTEGTEEPELKGKEILWCPFLYLNVGNSCRGGLFHLNSGIVIVFYYYSHGNHFKILSWCKWNSDGREIFLISFQGLLQPMCLEFCLKLSLLVSIHPFNRYLLNGYIIKHIVITSSIYFIFPPLFPSVDLMLWFTHFKAW